MARRWQQLPLDRALSGMPGVRLLLDDLAGGDGPVPDLGPAVVMDQLSVLVYDACEAGSAAPGDLRARLGELLRDLA